MLGYADALALLRGAARARKGRFNEEESPLAAALSKAEYRLIDGGSHLMAIEQPQDVVEAISTFLQQVDA